MGIAGGGKRSSDRGRNERDEEREMQKKAASQLGPPCAFLFVYKDSCFHSCLLPLLPSHRPFHSMLIRLLLHSYNAFVGNDGYNCGTPFLIPYLF